VDASVRDDHQRRWYLQEGAVTINEDLFAHTVTARDGAFDSGTMDGGDTFSQTFEAPGSYDYFCAIHLSMTGTVTVTP
jgi:plastocyanin